MGIFSAPKPKVPERDPELDRQLAEQRAENERIKAENAAREKREKDARLRGLRGSSALFANSFVGFGSDDADLSGGGGGGTSTLGSA